MGEEHRQHHYCLQVEGVGGSQHRKLHILIHDFYVKLLSDVDTASQTFSACSMNVLPRPRPSSKSRGGEEYHRTAALYLVGEWQIFRAAELVSTAVQNPYSSQDRAFSLCSGTHSRARDYYLWPAFMALVCYYI